MQTSRIIVQNNRDASITMNGRTTTDAIRQPVRNTCTVDDTRYDSTVNDSIIHARVEMTDSKKNQTHAT